MDPRTVPRAPTAAVVPRDARSSPYQIFMLVLCVFVLGSLGMQVATELHPETLRILDLTDTVICLVFFGDFLRSLVLATDRWRYLVTWGWLDLLSSIPAIDVFRWGRAARVFRILRVLRGLRASRILASFAFERRAESAVFAALSLAILVTIFGSIGILHLERVPGGNIRSAEDALWWAFVTVTTVGYGDHHPVTPSGRALAAVLMTTGIGLFGTFTAYLASSFLAPEEAVHERELAALREEVRELRDLLMERPEDSHESPGSRA